MVKRKKTKPAKKAIRKVPEGWMRSEQRDPMKKNKTRTQKGGTIIKNEEDKERQSMKEMKKNNTIIKCDADAVIASAQYEYLELVTEVIEGWRWHAQERSSM